MKFFTFALTLLLSCSPVFAEIVVTEDTQYFPVTGETKNEIKLSMQKNSPVKGVNSFAAATTRTQLSYEVTTQKRAGRCDVIKTKVLVQLTYTYPRLAQTPSKRVLKWWENELKKYEAHEKVHGDISKEYAKRLERKLQGMTNMRCATIKGEIQRRFNYYNRKMNEAHAEFDRKEQRNH